LENERRDDDDGGLYDEDEEVIGTEDVSKSIEDGIPYIPPTDPPQQSSPKDLKWKKRKKKTK